MAPLGLLSPGERAEVAEIREKKGYFYEKRGNHLCHVDDMGLRIGKTVEVLNNGGKGPVLIKIDELRLAIGRGMAMKIMVKKL